MSTDQVKILIVDDQPENILALESVLNDLGEELISAASGREALKQLLDHEFAIILMDLNMPGMTGFETAELIRSREKCRYTPIIFLTAAYTEDVHESEGYALGAVDFITKPFVSEILKSKVTVFVDLFKKTQEIKKQTELITLIERKRLQEARTRLDAERQLMQEELLRKEAERALLLERSLQLQKSEQLKTEFLANMSHEIRTPMHGIVGFIELLTRTELTEEQRQYAEFIAQSVNSLLTLINDILDLSKVESGKLDLETVDFDLRSVVEGTATLVAESVREKNLSLMTFIDPDIPPVLKGDPGRLRQILMNLISNAVKFTAEGEVVIRCQKGDTPEGSRPNSQNVYFSVSDSGIGIAKHQIPHLFKPFSQADGSTTRKYGGTGLGLSISKRLIELMGGDIGVNSELGKGSTFWFKITLPIATSSVPAPPLRDNSHRRVLVIDDHASARRIMQTYLQSWGMTCDIAMNGQEGLDLMRASVTEGKPYDIVITDLVLPGMDGFKLREQMESDPSLQKMKTLLITGYDLKDRGKAALAAGFSAYLTKPLEQSRLFNAIMHILTAGENTEEEENTGKQESEKSNAPTEDTVILLAEDNPVNQKVATLQLSQLGFRCQTANNGKEAADEYERNGAYALIFMDCQMPEMDGFTATKAIRDFEALKGTRIPIVGLTAYAMEGDRDRCIAAGMDDYVSKPSSFDKLAAVLKKWLPAHADAITERQKLLPKQRSTK